MKTLKQLLTDFLAGRHKSNPSGDVTLKSFKNEPEKSESTRATDVADPVPAEPAGEIEEKPMPSSEGGGITTEVSQVSPKEDLEMPSSPSLEETKETQDSASEAYQQGLIDGRNQRIEEIYFPKEDDGIPHFRGNASKARPASIFSMAREA